MYVQHVDITSNSIERLFTIQTVINEISIIRKDTQVAHCSCLLERPAAFSSLAFCYLTSKHGNEKITSLAFLFF